MNSRARSGITSRITSSIAATCRITTDAVGAQIAETYRDSYYRSWYELQDAERRYFSPPKLTQSQINVYLQHKIEGENWKDRIRGHYREYAMDMKRIIDNGHRNNIPVDEIQQIILAKTGIVGESGITYKIQRILRTESNHAMNAATASVYKRAGVEKYTYNSLLDDRSCRICDDLDMESHKKPFLLKEAKVGRNFPPMHPNCRCFVENIPNDKTKKFMEKGEKRRHLSYKTWYKQYVTR